MAKKVVTVDSNTAAIIKKYGNVIKTGSDVFNRNKGLVNIPVSTSFDDGLNGGILEGTWTVISGAPKSGKSSVCLQILANAQKLGKKGFYVDAESRLSNYNLSGINGLNMDDLMVIGPEDDAPLSADDTFAIIEGIVKDPANKGCVLVLDSISCLLPKSEMDAEVSATLRASLPKMITHWGKKIQQHVRSNKVALIIITHYITNTSGYGKKNVADSGTYIQYQASNRIDFVRTEDWMEGDTKVGIKISAEIDCSGNGSSGKTITSYVRFGKGIDSIKETMELAEAFGLIEKAGAWFSIPCIADISTQKFQGTANLYAFLESSPDRVSEIDRQIKEMMA